MDDTETPVDSVQAENKARTAHLRDVVLPGAAEAAEAGEVAEAVEAISDVKLPKTIEATIAMIRQGQAIQADGKTEVAVKEAGLVRLRAHLHTISQGPTCGPITTAAHTTIAKSSSDNADSIHMTQLCQSDKIVAARLADDAATIEDLTARAVTASDTIAKLTAELKKQNK
jgi:hypothetical protein